MRKSTPQSQPPTGYEQYKTHVAINNRAISDVTEQITALTAEAKSLTPRHWRDYFDAEAGVNDAAADQRVRRYTTVRAELKILHRELRQLEADRFLLRSLGN